ncbi:DNA-binding transcriptional regulator, PadR family [Natronoarchaeum philippinense]|uniref:DNA-binding transcriptional regulator, PadR family n=1 Tax=Natronoarchaeum philippinense TaxID=558529 RepID=A0A285N0P6_NATPI|nr:PadR family transcriptional regulator [Natronoarchaeum philippinense]SNZ03035.1 DNA-binding transcriptional regulator, PadR family [Natronoarchaeum philippinense]
MTKFLQSGRRRDLCVLLADAGELSGQQLKTRLEAHYDEHLDPKSFYGTLDALVDSGFLDVRTEGLADRYSLTDGGRRRLDEHVAWVHEHVDAE